MVNQSATALNVHGVLMRQVDLSRIEREQVSLVNIMTRFSYKSIVQLNMYAYIAQISRSYGLQSFTSMQLFT